MLRSSELVMKLNGSDAEQAADADGAYELVFGRSMGAPQQSTIGDPVYQSWYHRSSPAMSSRPALKQPSGSSLSSWVLRSGRSRD